MSKPFKGTIKTDIQESTPDWEPYAQPVPPDGAPNVLYVVLDDVGFSAMESFGGLIETPNIKRIADRGLLYTNFHTTALCSPTRSCLLTGRNHTTNSMACITEAASGFPNASGHIPGECAMIPAVLGDLGWNTYIVGKWHLCPEDEMNMASTKKDWPLGRGFERFYGFLGAETNQWYPDLTHDNHPVDPPGLPEDGYHFSVDITDKALSFIKDAKVVAPDKPFFLYYALRRRTRAASRPEGVVGQVQGHVRHGLRGIPRARFREPAEARDHPGERRAVTDQSVHRPEGPGRPELGRARRRAALGLAERRREAALLAHGRGVRRLPEPRRRSARADARLPGGVGQLDNTLIVLVSDNGASGEGGPNGSVNENKIFNGLPDTIEEALKYVDDLGSPKTYNHYPTGWAWAFNTPFKMWKRYASYQGGTADPMIVSWPARIKEAGIRTQYTHAVDIAPTIYELLGVELPEVVNGFTQHPLEGESFACEPPRRRREGKGDAVLLDARHPRDLPRRLEGRLGDTGRSERVGRLRQPALGALRRRDRPERVPRPRRGAAREAAGAGRALVGRGRQYGALPLESRDAIGILLAPRPQLSKPRDRYVYYPDCAEVPESVTPNIRNRSYAIAVEVKIDSPEASGVLFSQGSRFGGHALYLKDGIFKYVYNWVGEFEQIVESTKPIPVGEHVLSASFVKEGDAMPTRGDADPLPGRRAGR